MEEVKPQQASLPSAIGNGSAKKQIRGSSMLLAGRAISMGLNFTVQILTVRYLSKNAYGAFTYALSVVSMSTSLSLLRLDKALARFVPIYQEKQAFQKMFGTIVMAMGTVIGIGLSITLLILGTQGILADRFIHDPLALSLLLVVILLAPFQALDSLFENLLAVFAGARAIFFRRHLLGPGLRLVAVLLVMLTRADARGLAIGYLAGGILGTAVFVLMFYQIMRQQNLLGHLKLRQLKMPVREVFSFSLPLVTTDVVVILRSSMVVVLLEYLRSTAAVAEFRAVLPVADVNLLVFESFRYLYIPLASRLYARTNTTELTQLYWKTAVWITVFSFPIFALSFSLAEPFTSFLFGERYAQSAVVLAVLALGSYFNASLGFNYHTLSVYGRVRYLVKTDIITALLGIGLNLWLIPRHGALGAAIGVSSALITNNLLNHWGLWRNTGIDLFQWRYLRVYVAIALAAFGILLVQQLLAPPFAVGLLLIAVVSLLLVRINRDVMEVGETFPELLKVPLLRRLLTG